MCYGGEGYKGAAEGGLPYRSLYTVLFATFYAVEGVHQGLPSIYAYILLDRMGNYDISALMYVAGIATLPWSFKVFVGLINDRWNFSWGKRFPFIFWGSVWCGVFWILFGIMLPYLDYGSDRIYMEILIFGLFTNIGMAVADTSLDGLILDRVPKNKLGKIESITWTMLLAGSAGGGFLLAYMFLSADILHILFILTGIAVILTGVSVKLIPEEGGATEKLGKEVIAVLRDRESWKIFAYSFTDSIANPIVSVVYTYFLLISVGVIGIEESILSLASGAALDNFFADYIILQIGYAIGTVVGCYIAGVVADKNRKTAILLGYVLYIPMCILCIFFTGYIIGNLSNAIFGFSYGVLSIAGQTVRADIARNRFPKLRSAYFAVLISLSNFGLAVGSFLTAFIVKILAPIIGNFTLLTFCIMLITAGILAISLGIFLTIPGDLYNFADKAGEAVAESEGTAEYLYERIPAGRLSDPDTGNISSVK